MKVIFLDVDGVLNNTPSGPDFEPELVGWLNRLVAASGAGIVISSTWRLDLPLDRLVELLRVAGFDGQVIGVTPDLEGLGRGPEIAQWLRENAVESFVILDDEADVGALSDHLVRTSPYRGLGPREVKRALSTLKMG